MSEAKVIDGKAIAANVRAEVARDVARLQAEHGFAPGLAVVLVGEDPASKVYVKNKAAQTVETGMQSFEHKLPAETPDADLLALVNTLNADPAVNGILVQLPLPKHIDSEKILNAINPDKDVDGFHPVNVGRLWIGARSLVPCTPTGSLILAKTVHEKLSGLDAVVIGRSNIVGKPMASLLLSESCTVTVCHSPHQGPARRRPPRRPCRCRRRHSRVRQGRLDQAGRHGDRRRHQPRAQGTTARPSLSATATTPAVLRLPEPSRPSQVASAR